MSQRPLILVTNDDGVNAPGIRFLAKTLSELGDIVVVAPDKPMSGMGHAITIAIPLTCRHLSKNGSFSEYSVSGTPVDCVKLALNSILHRKPDLVVSGVNHGSNASVNIIYSGTMAAVLEACMGGVPAIGFSLLDFSMEAEFSHCREVILNVCSAVLQNGLPNSTCLNVNIPKISDEPLKGIKVCRQAKAYWKEEFDMRIDPHNRPYYWLKGTFNLLDDGEDTDVFALRNNFATIVPVHFDFTNHEAIKLIENWKLHE
jgi:5'-nucleotidase